MRSTNHTAKPNSLVASAVLVALGALTGAATAHADAAPAAADDSSLTFHGITLYGTVDIGLQFDTHTAPLSDYFPGGTNEVIQKNSGASATNVVGSNLSQSKIGVQGREEIAGDWAGVFKLETFFNPWSGQISDGLKSLTQNNGVALASQRVGIDTSIAGQLFGGAAYAGLSHPIYGTLTFGRQNGVLADGIAKYDPMGASQAFSVIGFSGTAAGAGDTEDRRLDNSIKYDNHFGPVHVAAQYQFNGGGGGSQGTAVELGLGVETHGLSVDGYYVKKYDAIATSALSACQLLGSAIVTTDCTSAGVANLGYAPDKSLSATVSDNTAYSLQASYKLEQVKLFAGYEHIAFDNPSTGLVAGNNTIGGYVLAYVNNDAYASEKTPTFYWAGAKYKITPQLELTGAYYGYKQNSYATGADAGCSSATVSSKCSGSLNAVSAVLDYRLTKRFDVYGGLMWSEVSGGLANGYLNTSNVDPTVGVRYTF